MMGNCKRIQILRKFVEMRLRSVVMALTKLRNVIDIFSSVDRVYETASDVEECECRCDRVS